MKKISSNLNSDSVVLQNQISVGQNQVLTTDRNPIKVAKSLNEQESAYMHNVLSTRFEISNLLKHKY